MKKYCIKNLSNYPVLWEYVNEKSNPTDIRDIWTTTVFDTTKPEEELTATKIKIFNSKSSAKPYLDSIKNARLNDWDENSHIYKKCGDKKPQWKIYEL